MLENAIALVCRFQHYIQLKRAASNKENGTSQNICFDVEKRHSLQVDW
jgi:hypothetical protein